MGYTIGKVFKKDEIVSKVETEQEESVGNVNSSEQTDVEETDNTNSDDSTNDEAEAPAKTTRRGRKKE